METRGIDQMLSELRSVSQVAQGKAVSPADAPAGGVNFADVLNNALKDVSAAQGEARGSWRSRRGAALRGRPPRKPLPVITVRAIS